MKKLLIAALVAAPFAAHAQAPAAPSAPVQSPGQAQYTQWMGTSLYSLLGQVDTLKAEVAAKDGEIDKLNKEVEGLKAKKAEVPVLPSRQPTEPPDAKPHQVTPEK